MDACSCKDMVVYIYARVSFPRKHHNNYDSSIELSKLDFLKLYIIIYYDGAINSQV